MKCLDVIHSTTSTYKLYKSPTDDLACRAYGGVQRQICELATQTKENSIKTRHTTY